MIDVQHTFHEADLERVLWSLHDLPGHLSPTYFGFDEGKYSILDRLDEKARFRKFVGEAKSGFFLYSERTFYGFVFASTTFRVSVFDVQIDDGLLIFRSLANGRSMFGFAANGGEYEHRNLLKVTHANGTSEAWVGRDLSRYVPGLYWRTWFSSQYLLERGLQHSMLCRCSAEVVERPDGYEYCFFLNPDLWLENVNWLDRLCEETPGIFSLSVAREAFEQARGIEERVKALKDWP
jgi:hypothetical protein